ncbi:hypothetical protein PAMP_023631 [Pampus punctatissimus]
MQAMWRQLRSVLKSAERFHGVSAPVGSDSTRETCLPRPVSEITLIILVSTAKATV